MWRFFLFIQKDKVIKFCSTLLLALSSIAQTTLTSNRKKKFIMDVNNNLRWFSVNWLTSAASIRPRMSKHTVWICNISKFRIQSMQDTFWKKNERKKKKWKIHANLCLSTNFTKVVCYCKTLMYSWLQIGW